MFSTNIDASKVLLGLAISTLVGCSPANDNGRAAPVGQVQMNLIGQAPSGSVYRLRDAIVRVDGPDASVVFDTESDPNRPSLSATVPAGTYESFLDPGWRLERLQPESTTQAVEAELLSPNPDQFSVVQDLSTQVTLRFRAGQDVVVIEQGSFDIILDVEDAPSPLAPCASADAGPFRDCDWAMAPGLQGVSCTPDENILVGCGCSGGGFCEGDPMIRVCAGQGACLASSAIALVDDACGVCPETSFTCPASGTYSVMVASFGSSGSFACEPVTNP